MKKIKCRTIFLASILCLFGIFGFSQNALAADLWSQTNSITFDGYSTVFNAGQASRTLPASYNRTNTQLTYVGTSNRPVNTWGQQITTSLTIVTRVKYSSSSTPRPVVISCPVYDYVYITNECNSAVSDDVFGDWHYTTWNFVVNGTIDSTSATNSLGFRIDIKNFSDTDGDIWFTSPISSLGISSFRRISDILTSTNTIRDTVANIDNRLGYNNTWIESMKATLEGVEDLLEDINTNSSTAAVVDAVDDLNDEIAEQNEKENEAVDNIENQSTSDISNSTSQQTQSLIATFSSFVSALGNVQSQGNCRITLPFAQQQGGSQTVDICTVKQDAGNDATTIINIIGSITMIVFYIPLVFIVLKMIYNEIRSFTNG